MLEIFTVAFFGHRYIDNPFKVEELLEEQIRKLINEKSMWIFWWVVTVNSTSAFHPQCFVYEKIIGMITAPLF